MAQKAGAFTTFSSGRKTEMTEFHSTKGMLPVVSEKLYVAYHRKTGRVVHIHRVLTLEGGQARPEADVHAWLLENALRLHKDMKRDQLSVTAVDPKSFRPHASHKVDLKTLKLVATPRRKRR